MSGWRVEPAHFVERHGLIVIIAIGESLIAIGLGARETELSTGVIVAALLGFVVSTSFWLAYFDFFPIRGQQLLSDRSGAERIALARDVYTYLHLPMVAGIVLFAFALKTTLAHVGDELDTIPALCLCGGPALYLFAYVAIRLRVSRTVGRGRVVAAVVCSLLIPVAVVVPALVALDARGRRLGRTPRVRDHLVARGSGADAGATRSGRVLTAVPRTGLRPRRTWQSRGHSIVQLEKEVLKWLPMPSDTPSHACRCGAPPDSSVWSSRSPSSQVRSRSPVPPPLRSKQPRRLPTPLRLART